MKKKEKEQPKDYLLSREEIILLISKYFEKDSINRFYYDLNHNKPFKSENKDPEERRLESPETFIKGSHQYCMSKEIFGKAAEQLADIANECNGAIDFEDIYNVVNSKLEHTKGIGPLTIYDISMRIAWAIIDKEHDLSTKMKRKLMPAKYVYLSRGAYGGAIRICKSLNLELKNIEYIGNKRCCRIPSEFFADLFRAKEHPNILGIWSEDDPIIPSWVIENILCVMFHYRGKGRKRSNRGCC